MTEASVGMFALSILLCVVSALIPTTGAQYTSNPGNLSCYQCVSTNYQVSDQVCLENSFDAASVALLEGCHCCRKAVSGSGVQRQCVRTDPTQYCKTDEAGQHNYICTSDMCNAVTSSLRLRNPITVVFVAIATLFVILAAPIRRSYSFW